MVNDQANDDEKQITLNQLNNKNTLKKRLKTSKDNRYKDIKMKVTEV